jgi:hypothetical protein
MQEFAAAFPYDFFLSQTIDSEKPLDWLINKREDANYKQGRFSEPLAPSHLVFAATVSLRQMLSAYSSEDIYVHSPEHAIVAFPFRLLIDLRSRLLSQGIRPLGEGELAFVIEHLKDRNGSITAARTLLT